MQYEILFLVGESHTAKLAETEKEIINHITESGGSLLDERWEDKRKLAYPIKHTVRGTFVARRFEVTEENVTDKNPIDVIQQRLRLMDTVLRYIIVRSDELPSLKDFSARKEEERFRHSQGIREEKEDRNKRSSSHKEKLAPISSDPFKKKVSEEEKPSKQQDLPETQSAKKEQENAEQPKKESTSSKDTKEIDEKLDEILNM